MREPGGSQPSPSCAGVNSEKGLVYLIVWAEGGHESVLCHVGGLDLVWAGIAKNELKDSDLSSAFRP